MEKKIKKKFIVPTIKEVEDYILEKKTEWPLQFIQFYAAQFWNHYEASGWKLSSGNAVKNWQACFNSQWQQLKYGSDQVLKQMLLKQLPQKKVVIEKKNGVFTVDHMNEVLLAYMKHSTDFTNEQLATYYDWMKGRGYIKLTQQELNDFIELYKDKKIQGRAACVTASFNKMVNYGIRFTDADRH